MLRDEVAGRVALRVELEQLRAEIVRARADAETQTRIVRELESERRAVMPSGGSRGPSCSLAQSFQTVKRQPERH